MIGQSEKSGIEIESEYQLTGHPVYGENQYLHFFMFQWKAQKKTAINT